MRNELLWRRARPRQLWNDDSGDWQALNSPLESPRYQAIARVINLFCVRPVSVLDVGCGEAILRDYLPASSSYFGIEPSRKAACVAMSRASGDRVFCGTADEFDLAGRKWNAVVFNEMLYYTADPVATVRRLDVLGPRGIRIVSIFQKPESLSDRISGLVGRRSMSNLRCTSLVMDLAAEQGWAVESDQLVNERWRILVYRQ